ncbi:YkgJ family cysteine cluster protein [Maridesulfovibrio ferrireducens]|uniref:YkgJ family cysteine cluster protein n=1 Tax=Maridesulfovibrio ferrireducens TaxID=246191 RepID=UPI001A2297FD|nr:YkgJ family cysteine cluster protein [Maridesulfovibrio ferrireducens]MBI9110575.1 YkgJ family cysteine cluster protein [Maridesulfovibrio ferrireducens]
MIKAFECQRCGHCCQGEGGIIMTKKDRKRLAEHLGLPEEEMILKYSETVNGKIRLQSREDGYCVFFNEGCGVHPGRPDVCRAWPFFRGNLVDKLSWEMVQDYCPGINNEAGHEQFVIQGKEYIRAEGLRQHDPEVGPNALITEDD